MLTGRATFEGAAVSEILAGVFKAEPDWNRLPAATPEGIRRLLRRCLQKDRSRRLKSADDARIEIEEALSEPPVVAPPDATLIRNPRLAWIVAAVATLAFASTAMLYLRQKPAAELPEMRLEINTPSTAAPLEFAVSPDGRYIVFVASGDGPQRLWLRALDKTDAQPLAGTESAAYPFWSPDSRSVGFFADGKLKRIDIVGGAQVLANATTGRGGAWNRDGTVIFAPTGGGPILKVPATGGEPVAVTRLETAQAAHKFPQFLPDGRHFIYFVQGGAAQGAYAGSLDGALSKRLASADAAAVVSPSGFLLFPRQTTLLAQRFDFKRQELSGNPFSVTEQVAFDSETNAAGFSATSGIVAYRSRPVGATRQLTWLDRSGKSVGAIGARDTVGLTDVELSPDGKSVAVYRTVNGHQHDPRRRAGRKSCPPRAS